MRDDKGKLNSKWSLNEWQWTIKQYLISPLSVKADLQGNTLSVPLQTTLSLQVHTCVPIQFIRVKQGSVLIKIMSWKVNKLKQTSLIK